MTSYDKFDQDMMTESGSGLLRLYWSLNRSVQYLLSLCARKNMLCNDGVVSGSSWTKGTKAEGEKRKKWGEEKGPGMQAIAQALHCIASYVKKESVRQHMA